MQKTPEETLLTSTQNPRIKAALHLRDRPARNKTERFLIEGFRELWRATEASWSIDHLFICPELFLGSNESLLIARLKERGAKIFHCSKPLFQKLSYRDRPDGLLAVAIQKHLSISYLDDLLNTHPEPLLLIAEAIEKPGNLGTILRSSDAAGIDALIVCDACTDIYNPNVVRASVGTLFTIPVIEAGSKELIAWLQRRHIPILAATPHAALEFTSTSMVGPLAIVVGTEQLGLSAPWEEAATVRVRIPMQGVADSLNVAMAATLLLYEAVRQRRPIENPGS